LAEIFKFLNLSSIVWVIMMSFLRLSYIFERFFLILCEKGEEQDPVHWQECCFTPFAKSQDYYIHRVPDPQYI